MEKFVDLKIENFSSSGEGIARKEGYVIFVENALPGEVVRAEILKENKNFAKAKVVEILESSKGRVKPFCALYNACGSCSLQHADYELQLKLKKEIVQDAMKKVAGLDIEVDDVVPSPENREFRCKIQYPLAQTKVSKRVLAGYYRPKSHELVNIKVCPIQPKVCDEIIEFMRGRVQELGIDCYDEKSHTGQLKHIVIRYSSLTKENLVTFVVNDEKVYHSVKRLCHEIFEKFDEVAGVCVNFNTSKSNVILGKKTEVICGNATIDEQILDKKFKIGANTFFQINPKSAENIFAYVKEILSESKEKPTLLDAYAGIASFGIAVSDVCKKVVSVEENPDATALVAEVLELNNINNLEVHTADSGKFMQSQTEKFDAIILDPPRKGCDENCLNEALRLAKDKIIYVSCNPATLARDLKYLTEKGAKVKNVKPFDMFCHTLHVETVAVIELS